MGSPDDEGRDQRAYVLVCALTVEVEKSELVDQVCETYRGVCADELATRIGLTNVHPDPSARQRLFFEILCWTAFLAQVMVKKHIIDEGAPGTRADMEVARQFDSQFRLHLVALCQHAGFIELREFVVLAVEPVLRFGLGHPLDPLTRLDEYAQCQASEAGKEVERFSKHIGKVFDAPKYPFLEVVGMHCAASTVEIARRSVAAAFID